MTGNRAPRPAAPPPDAPRAVGLNRRGGALIVDFFLLMVVLMGVSAAIGFGAPALAPVANTIGWLVIIGYFTVLSSPIGGGQTLGKRLSKIKAIGPDGRPPSLKAAATRYLALFGPFLAAPYLGGALLAAGMVFAAPVFWGTLLFVAFDRATHRGVHDRLADTRVVRADAPEHAWAPDPLGRNRGAVLTLIMLGGLAVASMTAKSADLAQMQRTASAAAQVEGVTNINLAYVTEKGGQGRTHAKITARVARVPADPAGKVREIARLYFAADPNADRVAEVKVELKHGVDAVATFNYTAYEESMTPTAWRKALKLPPAAAKPARR